jgi:hypothetical protein
VHGFADAQGVTAMTEFVVQDGFRRITFEGNLLARASSERSGTRRWTELALYRTTAGTYILEKIGASRVTHVRDCPEVVEDLPRFQEIYPGEDPDDMEFQYHDCVPEIYDFPSLLVEKDRPWAQISTDPISVIKSLMRYRDHSRWLPRLSMNLIEQAAELDDGVRRAYRATDTRIA